MIEQLLERIAGRLPFTVISGDDGEPYMVRYFLGRPGKTRFFLHNFLGSDPERGLHDHPWWWSVGIPLVGRYGEERLDWGWGLCGVSLPRFRIVKRFRPNVILGSTFHRIIIHREMRGRVWTFFAHGKRSKRWGFLTREGDFIVYSPHVGSTAKAAEYPVRSFWWRGEAA